VLSARQGVSASASRAGAGRLAGQVSGHLVPTFAGDHARIVPNISKLIETYPGRDLRHVCPVTFVVLAFLVFLVQLVTVGLI